MPASDARRRGRRVGALATGGALLVLAACDEAPDTAEGPEVDDTPAAVEAPALAPNDIVEERPASPEVDRVED